MDDASIDGDMAGVADGSADVAAVDAVVGHDDDEAAVGDAGGGNG